MLATVLSLILLCVAHAGDPTCSRGLISPNNPTACCPTYCGVCDQGNCAQMNGGIWECCAWGIQQKPSCSDSEAPCHMVAASPVVAMTAVAQQSVVRPSTIGIFPGSTNLWDKFNQIGAWPMTVLMYQDIRWLSFQYLKTFLDQGLQVQLVIEFWDNAPNLWALSGGSRDYELQQFFQQLKNDGRKVAVRILHEFNGNWYPWGIYNGGSNSVAAFLAAFRRISGVIRNSGANVSIQQAYNSMNVGGSDSYQSMYAGDQYLDEVTVSAYNFACIVGARNQYIDQIITPWYNAMSMNSKRLGISEMSSTGGCGVDKPTWIKDTWHKLAANFPRIQTVNWFFINKGQEDLDLNSWNEANAFSLGWYDWHVVTQSWAQGDLPTYTATEAQKLELDQADVDYKAELAANGMVQPDVVKNTPTAPDLPLSVPESGPALVMSP